MLEAGIKAAQHGNRAEAKILLLRATETEPGNEEAWMWLASVSEYPEELLGFLSHVLEINPTNERAVEWAKSTKSLLSKTFVERGISASKDAHKDFAKQCFLQAIAQNGENETAWLWLASGTDSPEEKSAYLQKVLSLDPKNENAIFLLKSIKNQKVDGLFQQAVAAAVADERKSARQILETVLTETPELVEAWVLKSFLVESFEEKISCFEKILDLDDENELANVNWTTLLDIMSKAELPTRTESPKHVLKPVENDFEEDFETVSAPASSVLDESNEVLNFNLVPDADKANELSAYQAEAANETAYFQPESNAPESGGADNAADDQPVNEFRAEEEESAESFAVSDLQENAAESEFFEIAAPESDYSPVQTQVSAAEAEDYSPYASEETAQPGENLPSYYEESPLSNYENEDSPASSNDYSPEFANSEQKYPENSRPNVDLQSFDESESFEQNPVEENPVEESSNEQSASEVYLPPENLPEKNFSLPDSADAESGNADLFVKDFVKSPDAMLDCPFCRAEGEAQSFVCDSCQTMLTMADLESLLAHQGADREILRQAVEQMEEARNRRDFSVEELKTLAVGQINLKNLRQGFAYLEEAARLNPKDVFLGSQVNFLKIRLAEIEEQKNIHDSMPKNRKILVVDDSATVRKLISGKLEKSGHEVFCAVDGIDALEKVKEFVPDLILLDINMPRMDGYQVCKLLRGDEATREVPIVMISGKDGFFDKVRGRMAGTTGYITKPFGPETLMKMLETYIV